MRQSRVEYTNTGGQSKELSKTFTTVNFRITHWPWNLASAQDTTPLYYLWAPHQRKLFTDCLEEEWRSLSCKFLINNFLLTNGVKHVFLFDFFFPLKINLGFLSRSVYLNLPHFFWWLGFIPWDGYTIYTKIVHFW